MELPRPLRHDDPEYREIMRQIAVGTACERVPHWEPDALAPDEAQALAALGVNRRQVEGVRRLRSIAAPRPRIAAVLDDDEFDDIWDEDRGSQIGLRSVPLGRW